MFIFITETRLGDSGIGKTLSAEMFGSSEDLLEHVSHRAKKVRWTSVTGIDVESKGVQVYLVQPLNQLPGTEAH
ncbi:hypothetical protein GWI33_012312 [Rhynchophorus ferrugineus]|uniref:Uncharacterized protein n=1 Tax=Rhynchophorus ferrugineus TaxID=354439 RepID=A0A834IU01_RHYFE|nr:hypothetical protein GWI33_012312 [Rhynchophorus ferrugineus]